MNDRPADHVAGERLGAEVINEIGVPRIAEALGISVQAVRKWRTKQAIPDDRQDAIRRLLVDRRAEVAMAPKVAKVSAAPAVSLAPANDETCSQRPSLVTPKPTRRPVSITPTVNLDLNELNGKQAGAAARLLIAARDVRQNQTVAEKAAAAAEGFPPTPPVKWYRARLAVLFALDFPILTIAFAAVTQVSPMRIVVPKLLFVWALYPEMTSAQQEDISISSLGEALLPADAVAGYSVTPMPNSWRLSSDFKRSFDGEARKNSRESIIDSYRDNPCDEVAAALISILINLSGILHDGCACECSP